MLMFERVQKLLLKTSKLGNAENKKNLEIVTSQILIEKDYFAPPNPIKPLIEKIEHFQQRSSIKCSSSKAGNKNTFWQLSSRDYTENVVFHSSKSTMVLIKGLGEPKYRTRKLVNVHRAISDGELHSEKVFPSKFTSKKTVLNISIHLLPINTIQLESQTLLHGTKSSFRKTVHLQGQIDKKDFASSKQTKLLYTRPKPIFENNWTLVTLCCKL